MRNRGVRIGCASGFWGDSSAAAPQRMRAGVEYAVFDFLAEITMSLLARAELADCTDRYSGARKRYDWPVRRDFAASPIAAAKAAA